MRMQEENEPALTRANAEGALNRVQKSSAKKDYP
jgi:hypothetical protein